MKNAKGLSLIEIVISISVIAILIGISYPLYASHKIKHHRILAEEFLIKLADKMILFHAYSGAYATIPQQHVQIQDPLGNIAYQFEIQEVKNNRFVLAAVPQGTQRKDTRCQTLTLNSLGEKGITGDGNIKECWQR